MFVGRDADEAEEMFCAETFGGVQPNPSMNRYAAGKRFMGVTASMWSEDISCGMLMKFELLDDPTLRGIRWWVERVLSRILGSPNALLPNCERGRRDE